MAVRYLYGETNPIPVTIATAKAVNIGDPVGLASNTVVKPSDIAWDTDLATTQTAFAATFVGLSGQFKAANQARVYGNGEDNLLKVATTGEFEVELTAAATVEVGEYYAPAKDTGNALVNDKWVKVSTEAAAIAIATRRGTTVTKANVKLLSKLSPYARQA